MTFFGGSWIFAFSEVKQAFSGLHSVHNVDPGFTGFAPGRLRTKGHVLKIIIPEEDVLQVVDDHMDGPVGGVPHL